MGKKEPEFGEWIREHAGLIPVMLTGLAFMFVLLHLAIVSRFNATTARTLVESAGPGTVIMASLVSALFPVLVALFLFFAVLRFVESITGGKKLPRYSRFASAAIVAVLFFIPVTTVGLLIVFALVMYVMRVLANRWRQRTRNGLIAAFFRSRADRSIVFTTVLIAALLSTASVWVPSERVTLANRQRIVGYVLGEEAGWYTLMTERDRRVVRVPVDEVRSRHVCALDVTVDPWAYSPAEWFVGGNEANYPPCVPPEPMPSPSPST